MIRLATDARLHELALLADERSDEVGDYMDRSALFLRSLVGKDSLTLKQHNWLSALKTELAEIGDDWK